MRLVLARVDNRLIHGQVLQTWVPETSTDIIIVVDDSVACDPLRQSIMEAALPADIKCIFIPDCKLKCTMDTLDSGEDNVMLLFSSLKDVKIACESGAKLETLNIGNIHYEEGKTRISPGVCLGCDEVAVLRELAADMEIEIRATPSDNSLQYPAFLGGESLKEKPFFRRVMDKLSGLRRGSHAGDARS